MNETKNLCAQIPVELHTAVTQGKDESGLPLSSYITQIITEYYELKKGGNTMNADTRTLAIQVPTELMDRVKVHLKATGISQKAWLISIIEQALESAETQTEGE